MFSTNPLEGQSCIKTAFFSVGDNYMILSKEKTIECWNIYQKEGISIEKIAKILDVKFNDIFQSCRFYGYKLRKSGEINKVLDINEENDVITKYKSGISVNKISKIFNIDRSVVLRIFKECGIQQMPIGTFNTTSNYNEDTLIKLYNSGLSNSKIAKELGITPGVVGRFLERKGLDINFPQPETARNPKKHPLTERIIELFLLDYSYAEISRTLKTNHCLVSRIIKKNGFLYKEKSNRKYTINELFFNEIDSIDKALILGIIFTDGCNSYNNGKYIVSVELKSEDKDVLDYINKCFNSNRPLRYREDKDTLTLKVNSQIMSNSLLNLGCTCPKSLTLEYPSKLEDKYFKHFLHGCIIGDGFICGGNNLLVGFSGTKNMCEEMMKRIKNYTNMENSIQPESNCDTLFRFVFSGFEGVRLCNHLFQDATFIMKRKYLKYKEFVLNKYKEIDKLRTANQKEIILEAIKIINKIEAEPRFIELLKN